MENRAPILDMNSGVRPSSKVKLFKFNNIFLANPILFFVFSNIVLLLLAHLDVLHQEFFHL